MDDGDVRTKGRHLASVIAPMTICFMVFGLARTGQPSGAVGLFTHAPGTVLVQAKTDAEETDAEETDAGDTDAEEAVAAVLANRALGRSARRRS